MYVLSLYVCKPIKITTLIIKKFNLPEQNLVTNFFLSMNLQKVIF